ncbi:universal stress protein [Seonamhaeicola sp. NFXS20]|uniref:universal stress protein n=1 Tax=Seonamhaeicola sp. NFXS20 TaxID=2816959 RepID=UPI003B8DF5BD
MKNNRYKILVLSDLSKRSDTILKTTANLAKMIGGDINLLHVKKPVDVIETDNQLSSIRTFNRDYLKSKNNIETIVKSVDKQLHINYDIVYGNVKQEIETYIQNINPDIIVLGKKRFNALKLIGDNLTKFILKKYKGTVLIASNNNVLEYNENLSLGILNDFEHTSNADLTKSLMNLTQKPIKAFKIKNSTNLSSQNKKDVTSNKTVEYVFEPNSNVLNNLSNYLLKSNVGLLCINKNSVNTKSNKGLYTNINLDGVIKRLNVSLLLTA